jgi:hypothetical protein
MNEAAEKRQFALVMAALETVAAACRLPESKEKTALLIALTDVTRVIARGKETE